MKRILRTSRLTPEEIARDKEIIEAADKDLPEMIEQFKEQLAALDQLPEVVSQLKAARESKGLSLSDVSEAVGMDRSALSKLENGRRPNPTVETLVRYAQAVGKRLVVKLTDA